MLKKLWIQNFKAIRDLTIEFTPFTVLIGENSSGKSTVLQALDFLRSIASQDIDEYLKDREWDFADIKSQGVSAKARKVPIRFVADFVIEDIPLTWDISVNHGDGKWDIQESVYDTTSGAYYLYLGPKRPSETLYDFSQFGLKSSALKLLDVEKNVPQGTKFDKVLQKLKSWLASSNSFELLSPDKMRSRSIRGRGQAKDIGMGGERLAAYLLLKTSPLGRTVLSERREIERMVSDFIGHDVRITATAIAPGLDQIYLEESWNTRKTKVNKHHISDGLLRVIALSTILASQGDGKRKDHAPLGFITLDEIEDGINPDLSEKFMASFKRMAVETNRQVVITTHSPVMVNFVDESDIQFMWRDRSGTVHVKPLFQTKEMKETLDFLGPGEVWMNYGKESIVERLSAAGENA